MNTPNALTLCNCCEANEADPRSRAGYCRECEDAARADELCWHE